MNPFDFWSIDTDRRANKGPELYNVNKPESKVHCTERFDLRRKHSLVYKFLRNLENSSRKFNSKGEKYISVW